MTSETDVLIVGAGACGLMLGVELARRGVAFRLIERAPAPFAGSRGKGLQPRTLEVLDMVGAIDAILAAGAPYPPIRRYDAEGGSRLEPDPKIAPTPGEPHPGSLLLAQSRTEGVLRNRLTALGGDVEFGTELLRFEESGDRVVATFARGGVETSVACRWLVGCDGGRSTVRKSLGVGFPGETRPVRMLIADLPIGDLERDAWHRWPLAPGGQLALCPLTGVDSFQMAAEVPAGEEPDLSTEAIHRIILNRTGRGDLKPGEPSWTSLYRVNVRLADAYRLGRVLLAGDAAHVHPPTGGQGLNTSLQDAFNLGWKLAASIQGAPADILDSYEAERRPVAAGVLDMSTGLLTEMIQKGVMTRTRETYQLDLSYRGSPMSQESRAHPGPVQAGDRAPDGTLHGPEGAVRLFRLFGHTAPTLLAYETALDAAWRSRPGVQAVEVEVDGGYADTHHHLRDGFGLEGPTLLLVRPDGYVAAATDGDSDGIEAVKTWLDRWIGHRAAGPTST